YPLLYCSCSVTPPYLHSFPTRRSSDLGAVDASFPRCLNAAGSDPDAAVLFQSFARDFELRVAALDNHSSARVVAREIFVHGCSRDRKSTRLNSSHRTISYAVFCLKKKI